ncbi:HAD family hydrolase [Konateibacter massiliensis]|uniref:HAD family hydrolase n=1 Tax=Konateibacter massiliensis TaxID=2002841 RepID=UPI000C15609C|nr:HAD family hydrolase [Konateibacter massiliensis]
MKTLYVTDLDGTLLNRQDRISQKSLDIINKLVGKGMTFTYATARSLVSASVVTKGLSANIPVVSYNGAFIINPSTDEILLSSKFSKEDTEKVITVLQKYDISPLVYAYVDNEEKVSWLTSRENDGIKRYLSLRKNDRRLRPLSNSTQLYMGDMFYFTCIGEKEELLPIYEIFSKDERFRCTIQQELYRPEYWCDIMPAKATKAEAIKKLKEIMGCERVVSFGDAINDIPMFELSDECYAVENAVDELKALATGVIGSNEEDGVAEWLRDNVTI